MYRCKADIDEKIVSHDNPKQLGISKTAKKVYNRIEKVKNYNLRSVSPNVEKRRKSSVTGLNGFTEDSTFR